jgi:8-oxo-dGTP pyrophosphatase MutT (NUDIX family)
MPHINEAIDFTIEVFVVFQNKVLLRKHDKYHIWLSIGGHIDLNEDPNQAAIREVKEEVGLDIKLFDQLQIYKENTDTFKELVPPYSLNIHKISDTHKHVTMVYFATSETDKIKQTEGEENSEECRWFSKEDLIENKELKENVRFYALKAIDTILN